MRALNDEVLLRGPRGLDDDEIDDQGYDLDDDEDLYDDELEDEDEFEDDDFYDDDDDDF